MADDPTLALLRILTGDLAATFRPGQREAIDALVAHRQRVLVVQRTGWGKSAVYFTATRLLRDRGAGPTLIVSPLLALMRNQIAMAARLGVHAATINSGNVDEWDAIEAQVEAGQVDVLLISPERLNNPRFRTEVLPQVVGTVGLLVVDEAHCISDWGHDFRPDYRRIARVLQLLPPTVPVLCTTATANDRVVHDIEEQLGDDLTTVRGPLHRESLELAVVDLPQPAQRLAWLATVVPSLPGSGIVYCLTVADTRRVADWLRARGIDALAYSGDTDNDERLEVEDALLANTAKVVVATSALGMGFDKPDLGFVIHYQSPGSPIAYYQQVGRAGRGLDRAPAVLLRGHEDADIQDFFIRTAFPPQEQAEAVVAFLAERAEPVPIGHIEAAVNARRSRIEAMLKVLEVEGALERADGGWRRTLRPWAYDTERVHTVTALRRAEQQAMVDYAATDRCRMAFLLALLDDPDPQPCGRCDTCTGTTMAVDLEPALVAEAVAHLRRSGDVLEPRKRWPAGRAEPRGNIARHRQLQPGRVLGTYGDGGWGSAVKRVKHASGDGDGERAWPAELLDAAAASVAAMPTAEPLAWVTTVPSATSGDLVGSLARGVAERLGLPCVEVLARTRSSRPQKEMENSAQQVANVYGAFAVTAPLPAGAVLLVDDTVDSRWTVTEAGRVLLEAGSGPVHPFAAAKAMSD